MIYFHDATEKLVGSCFIKWNMNYERRHATFTKDPQCGRWISFYWRFFGTLVLILAACSRADELSPLSNPVNFIAKKQARERKNDERLAEVELDMSCLLSE